MKTKDEIELRLEGGEGVTLGAFELPEAEVGEEFPLLLGRQARDLLFDRGAHRDPPLLTARRVPGDGVGDGVGVGSSSARLPNSMLIVAPFCSETTRVRSPTSGAARRMARSVSYDLTQRHR